MHVMNAKPVWKWILSVNMIFAAETVCAQQLDARGQPQTSKLLLTNGATSIEGASGGGLATWAVIAGNGTRDQIGASNHATILALPDFTLRSFGASVGIRDRIEVSYTQQNFNTREVGAALGLGQGFQFNQHIYGAKIRLFGDAIYGESYVPQVAVGLQHKRNRDGDIVRAVGAQSAASTEFYVSATKMFLAESILANMTFRLTNANQGGLLGFGATGHERRDLHFESSLAYQLSRRLIIGAEYRSRPNNNLFVDEDDALDVFVTWSASRHVTLTTAYVDLGSIAGQGAQRGLYMQCQFAL